MMNESEISQQNESLSHIRHKASQNNAASPKSFQNRSSLPAQKIPLSKDTYFLTMQEFMRHCVLDKRLSPNTQLLYHTLVQLANRAFWLADFIATDSELVNLTHMSKQSLTESKRRLMSLGYIDCHGKPNKYTIYTLQHRTLNPLQGHSGGNFNTQIPKYNTSAKKKTSKEESEAKISHDADLASDTLSSAEFEARVAKLKRMLKSHY